jgi:hypothetical protein
MTRREPSSKGQALVEFAFGIIVFLALLIGTIDLGRGVYMYNGVSQAAREIARETSVHPGTGALGGSAETQQVVAVQQRLVPGLRVSSYACTDIAGTVLAGDCRGGEWVTVTVTTRFQPVMPLLTMLGPIDLTSSSGAEIQ